MDAAGGWGWPDGRSPFPGLHPFQLDQHRVFFGRNAEQKELTELLRSMAERADGAVLLVTGPSGCGKSSLVRAGLLPVMADEPGWWPLQPIKPGANPVAMLIRELSAASRRLGLDWTEEDVRHQLDGSGLSELVSLLLHAAPRSSQQRVLLVVDQYEELITQTSQEHRARFVELLSSALTGPVQLVATLRPEFLDQLLVNPELGVLPTHIYTLRPLPRAALRAVIEGPARWAALEVDEHLVTRLVTDTDSGEALPLLAFTLAQLADGIGRGGKLSEERYDRLGGVQGALIREADAALQEAVRVGGRSREQVISGLLRLVTVDEQGRPTRWRAPREELPDPAVTELDAFVKRRLLTTDADNGSVVTGVAHEAFLSAWPPLAEASAAAASALRARRAVEHAATEWNEGERAPSRLWGGGQLAAAVADTGVRIHRTGPPQRHRVLVTDHVALSHSARDFLLASIRRDRHRRRRAITVLSVLLVIALVSAGVALFQRDQAQNQQRIATARQLVAQAGIALATDPRTALQLSLAANHINPTDETSSSLINTLNDTQYAGTLTGHTGTVSSVVFSPERHLLATRNTAGNIILWDLADPAQPHQMGPPFGGDRGFHSESMVFSPDGRALATSGFPGVVIWDLSDPARPRRLDASPGSEPIKAGSFAFSPDGRTLAARDYRDNITFRDLIDPARSRKPQPLQPSGARSYLPDSVAFSPDLHTVATSSRFGTSPSIILWDLTDPTGPRQLGELIADRGSGSVQSMAFSPDGRTLVTISSDNAIYWDISDRAQPRRLTQPPGGSFERALGGSFFERAFTRVLSADLHSLATISENAVIVWDLTTPAGPRKLERPLVGHTDEVSSMAFSPDRSILATGSADGSVILWDLTDVNKLQNDVVGRACAITGGGLDKAGWDRYIPGLPYEDTCPG